MSHKPNFSEDVKREALEECRWVCRYCCERPAVDPHHALPNTVVNQKKFPNFLQSKKNLIWLCRQCHEDGRVKNHYRISDEAAQRLEEEMSKNNT